ncbi:MAG: hypothetical protein H6711_28055 [Myxococcales bacterium]|nr:hypothetical protein [Myxococcales bacterium]
MSRGHALAIYRADPLGQRGMRKEVEPFLETAGEALHVTLLTLAEEGHGERSGGDLLARAAQARSLLAEAVLALGRARLFHPEIHTYSLAVVMTSEPEIHAELTRLHQLTSRLLWYNIAYLPARRVAAPLAPEDEAQLDVVVRGLARTAKIDRVLQLGWLPVLLLLSALGPIYGVPLFGLAVAVMATAIAGVRLAQMQRAELPAARG